MSTISDKLIELNSTLDIIQDQTDEQLALIAAIQTNLDNLSSPVALSSPTFLVDNETGEITATVTQHDSGYVLADEKNTTVYAKNIFNNLQPGNIAAGVNIGGVTGTLENDPRRVKTDFYGTTWQLGDNIQFTSTQTWNVKFKSNGETFSSLSIRKQTIGGGSSASTVYSLFYGETSIDSHYSYESITWDGFVRDKYRDIEILDSFTYNSPWYTILSILKATPLYSYKPRYSSMIEVPDRTFLDAWTLHNADLTVNNSSGLTKIGISAFENSGLITLQIPYGVQRIEDRAFANCLGLYYIRYGGTCANWNAITKGTDWNLNLGANYIYCSDGQVYARS